MNKKILHIMILDKFLAPFIDFVDENFGREDHHYVFITSEKYNYGLTPEHQVEFLHTDDDIFITLLGYMKEAQKIILHGLWRDKVDLLLLQNPELFKKCYWVIWGGDFYFPEKQGWVRKQVIRNMGNIIGYTEGDVDKAKEWYGFKGKVFKCFAYTSNIFLRHLSTVEDNEKIRILVGNSADPTNNHLDIFERLLPSRDKIIVYASLSYGNKEYAKEVVSHGYKLFGNNFKPLLNFLPYQEYLNILSTIDIAIFNHNRQQAVGNILSLLGMGKKVYIHGDTTFFIKLRDLGVEVFDTRDLLDIDKVTYTANIAVIEKEFSKDKLISDWLIIFDYKTL